MENKYLKIGDKKECNGCEICTKVCKFDAIKMVEDSEGFYYPKIDEKKCKNCGACKRICSNFNDSKNESDIYLARVKDKEALLNSSSGGMFYVLAKYVIEKGGEVFGVEYGENLKVQHNHYSTMSECQKFSGSKYVRSDLGSSFEDAKKYLDEGKYVLFTGTSCQCNALKIFLGKDYEKLILCDILCHANPSQKIFNAYVKEIERKNNKKVVDVEFRAKKTGWKNQVPIIVFEDGTEISDNMFFLSFVNEMTNRTSCSFCKFATPFRVTDFTIGDFWGLDKVYPNFEDDDKGQSLLLVNTDKGRSIFEDVCFDMEYKKCENELPLKYNHFSNVPAHKNRDKFFANLDEEHIIEEMKKYLRPSFGKRIKMDVREIKSKLEK